MFVFLAGRANKVKILVNEELNEFHLKNSLMHCFDDFSLVKLKFEENFYENILTNVSQYENTISHNIIY
jgi:hypothetical protein